MATSSRIKKLSMATAGAALIFCGIIGKTPTATAQTITFDNDSIGTKTNGFQSNDSPLLSFSTFNLFDPNDPGQLRVGNFSPQSVNQGIGAFGDTESNLTFDFSVPVTSLSLLFGNDDNGLTLDGDRARLDILNNDGTIRNTVNAPFNRNNSADQTISFSDGPFNSARLTYSDVNGQPIPLAEIVDNVTFQQVVTPTPTPGPQPEVTPQPLPQPEPIPEPSSVLGMLTFGAFAGIAIMKRKRGKC